MDRLLGPTEVFILGEPNRYVMLFTNLYTTKPWKMVVKSCLFLYVKILNFNPSGLDFTK